MPCSEADTKSGNLVIRYNNADTGTRPIDPCTGYWLSPDLWLEGGVDTSTAKVGVANTVKVRVTNNSNAPISSVNVQVWVCNFTLGISPASGIASAGGANPMTGFVSSIDPGAANAATIACSPTWTPAQADAALNGGHVCLAGNCYSDDSPPDGATIPPDVFNFCCNCHHGQRNIAVKAVPGFRRKIILEFPLFIANPHSIRRLPPELRKEQPFIIRLKHLNPKEAAGPEIRAHLKSHPCAKLGFHPSELKPKGFSLSGRGLECKEGSCDCKITIPAEKQMPVEFQAVFSPEELVGHYHAFDLVQMDLKGEVVGGATVVAVIVP
jgi:hypothetical protein